MKNALSSFSSIFFALLLGACQNTPEKKVNPAAVRTTTEQVQLNALYQSNEKVRLLRDCDSGKTYWVENAVVLDSLRQHNLMSPNYNLEPVFVKVSGKLTLSDTGPGANYDGLFALEGIETVETLNFMNCCETYDFWCGGTEPFWDCQIFPPDGFIIFREVGGATATVFPAAIPEIKGKTRIYTSKNEAGEQIKITIIEEPASDGMSEITYNFSSKIELGKRKFTGTARKYGEKNWEE